MMIGITDEETKAFMMQMLPEQTADIKGEDNEEFYVEKVIKMRVNKEGREEFLVKWVGYPLSEATWTHLKIFLKRKHVSIKLFLFTNSQFLFSS